MVLVTGFFQQHQHKHTYNHFTIVSFQQRNTWSELNEKHTHIYIPYLYVARGME